MKSNWIRAAILLIGVACSNVFAETPDETDGIFEAPVILMVGDKPMNEDGRIMYPSPAIFDVDNDGRNELVLGSIFGGVYVCENENNQTGDPVWSKPTALKTAKNKPLELNNW